ncbi:MAG: transposase [candidate division NC10 bacterium]|nr:transposase [candidate division NC10 bacterium]MDE2321393.1 transposase [candidate division NC10 bacterium]
MKGIPQGRYTKEFREEAVKLVTEGNMTIPAAARRLALPPSTVGNWLRASTSGKLSEESIPKLVDIAKQALVRDRWQVTADF